MVLIWLSFKMVQDTLRQNPGHAATTVDGRNAFNSASRQKILDLVYSTFPQLAVFVETWYLIPSPLWFYMIDHTVGTILSREGVQQGDVIATFLFTLICSPVLHNIFTRMDATPSNFLPSWLISRSRLPPILPHKCSQSAQRSWRQ